MGKIQDPKFGIRYPEKLVLDSGSWIQGVKKTLDLGSTTLISNRQSTTVILHKSPPPLLKYILLLMYLLFI
jgi:hypothetical protein